MKDKLIIVFGIVFLFASIGSAYAVYLWMKVFFFRLYCFWIVFLLLSIIIGAVLYFTLPNAKNPIDRFRAALALWVFVLPIAMNAIYWFNSFFARSQSQEQLTFESYTIYEQRVAKDIVLAFDLEVYYQESLHDFHSQDNTILAYEGKKVFMNISHGCLAMDYWIPPAAVDKN